jgi:hypothetical protein
VSTHAEQVLGAALGYSGRGFSTVPLKPKSKKPGIAWEKYQSEKAGEETLQKWFGNGVPNNVGIVTGKVSGIAVVDYDSEEAIAWGKAKGVFGLGPVARTAKGCHEYFLWVDGAKTWSRRFPGVDFRAEGGLVVAPPSIHPSGKKYRWVEGRGLDEVPMVPPPEIFLTEGEREASAKKPLRDEYQGVAEGARNEALTRLCGSWARDGLPKNEMMQAALAWNQLNDPPMDEEEVARTVQSISGREQKSGRPPSRMNRLIELASAYDLFHDKDGNGFAAIEAETYRIGGRAFNRQLSRAFYAKYGKGASAQDLKDACLTIEGKAVNDGPEQPVFVRLAGVGDTIIIDVADEARNIIKVTSSGWSVSSERVVHFLRPPGLAPLLLPTRGGSVNDLREFVNLENEDDFPLVVALVLACLAAQGPFPGGEFNGEQGAAKSTTVCVIKQLTDPSTVPLRSLPRDLRDLAIAAGNSRVLSFDNVSSIPDDLSDALCRLSTGGGFATRTLHTDQEETLFFEQRPFMLNGINAAARREDLTDRLIRVTLAPIPEEQRQSERDFWRNFEEKAPSILGALLDAVSCALREYKGVKLSCAPRMADFAVWVTAAEPALGWEPGTFLREYARNRAESASQVVDSNLVLSTVATFMRGRRQWQGTPTELLEELGFILPEETRRSRWWPKSASYLSRALNRGARPLAQEGVKVSFKRIMGARLVALERLASPEETSGVNDLGHEVTA